MAFAVCLTVTGNKNWPYKVVKYTPKIKAALIFDGFLIMTLFVVGFLALSTSVLGMALGFTLLLGIGVGCGGGMIILAALITLVDFCVHTFNKGCEGEEKLAKNRYTGRSILLP